MNCFRKIICYLCVFTLLLCLPVTAAANIDYPFGDATLDYTVNVEDARQTLRFAIKLDPYTKAHVKICDTDGSGAVDVNDARNILRAAIGLGVIKGSVSVGDADFASWVYNPGTITPNVFEPVIPLRPNVANKKSGTFIFYVYGSGHGLGMSQYGAVALAGAGYSYYDILMHYFTDVSLASSEVPATTKYVGNYYDTQQLVARIVYNEIYGITNGGTAVEAIKAQAICAYTLLKKNGFSVSSKWTAGVASSLSYAELPEVVKSACREVSGLYLTANTDVNRKAIESFYGASVGGATANNTYIFGSDVSYLQSVPSPFDMNYSACIFTKIYTRDQVRSVLSSYSNSLGADPAQWIQIISHTESIDADRGYVTAVKIGDTVVSNASVYTLFCSRLGLPSSCFTVEYVP